MSSPDTFFRILAIETATRHQALALLEGDLLLAHRVQRVRYNHGSSLLQNIDQLLAAQKPDLDDIDLFVVGLGPGSFTGLRVGLATAKALARATETPIVGVSSLAAAAYIPARNSPQSTMITAFDARRRELYAAAFRTHHDHGLITVLEERTIDPGQWIATVEQQIQGPLHLIGDGISAYPALHDWTSPRLTKLPGALAPPSAIGLAILGRIKAHHQGPADIAELEPNYIRASDARLPQHPLRSIQELEDRE